ncbi:uncharacterized protein LOC116849210 [Odontomachus brunneus]|uniref:uncharacterized protein LOC116849210 n=1 Tax=Odontomachus brunneus TaxID=486640 RepID=UPI0013F29E8B|nr:uncharacterized protein LOC116849210 [Odontomachus brunneus]
MQCNLISGFRRHLHLELCKISRVLNLTFGLQMTIKMGAYFVLEMIRFSEFLNMFLVDNYNQKKTLFMVFNAIFLILNIFKLFILNYMCEKVNIKANATGDVLNRIPYSTLDVVTRENISQLLLQLRLKPLKFYGLGLFQFGLKFFYKFSSSLSTVIVILV